MSRLPNLGVCSLLVCGLAFTARPGEAADRPAPLTFSAVHASYSPQAASAGAVTDTITNFVTLHGFTGGTDGIASEAALVQATDGSFYGTTTSGGSAACELASMNCGTVFRMTPGGTVTTLHAFTGGTDGSFPRAALLQAKDGNLYGTTYSGGDASCNCGTIFRMTLGGSLTTLHTFTDVFTGFPQAALIQARDGNFYGTAGSNMGQIFRMRPDGDFTILHDFTPTWQTEGYGFAGIPLVQGSDGDFYGTTQFGGNGGSGFGTAFRMTSQGMVTVLHSFPGGADGAYPGGPLIQGLDGNFYGMTNWGGTGYGTVFRMTRGGGVTVIHSFANSNGYPYHKALLQGTDGNFYGTSSGMAFQVTPAGTVTPLHTGGTFGGPLIHARDGSFYGTRYSAPGEGYPLGDVFRLTNPSSCDDTLTLGYAAGTLTMGFTLKTPTPATWSTWLVPFSGGAANLWSVRVLTPVSPAIAFDVPLAFPAIGNVLALTTLTTPAGIACADWKVVNTGGPAAAVSGP